MLDLPRIGLEAVSDLVLMKLLSRKRGALLAVLLGLPAEQLLALLLRLPCYHVLVNQMLGTMSLD